MPDRRSLLGRHGEQGTATAELAVAVPAVSVLLGAVIAVGQATVAQVQVVDAARAGARAAARGDDGGHVREVASRTAGAPADEPADVSVSPMGPDVTVTVTRRVRLLLPHGPRVQVSASAVAQRESGSATVLVAAVVALAIVLAGLTASLGAVLVARHRAQSSADLGALAAADVLLGRAPGPPCAAAARVVTAVGGDLRGCHVADRTAVVRVNVRPNGAAGRLGTASARARAGPPPGTGQGSR